MLSPFARSLWGAAAPDTLGAHSGKLLVATRHARIQTSVTSLKETLLYFDYVVPLTMPLDFFDDQWLRHWEPPSDYDGRRDEFQVTVLKRALPPAMQNPADYEQLSSINWRISRIMWSPVERIMTAEKGFVTNEEILGYRLRIVKSLRPILRKLIRQYDLKESDVSTRQHLTSKDDSNASDIALTLVNLHLIDLEPVTWEQIQLCAWIGDI